MDWNPSVIESPNATISPASVGARTSTDESQYQDCVVEGSPIVAAPVKDAQGRQKIGLNAETKINRKDFNIIWNEVLDGGGLAVADMVTITLDIEMIRN